MFCLYSLCTIPPKSIKKFHCTIFVYVCQAPEYWTVHPDGSIFTFCHANSLYFAVSTFCVSLAVCLWQNSLGTFFSEPIKFGYLNTSWKAS